MAIEDMADEEVPGKTASAAEKAKDLGKSALGKAKDAGTSVKNFATGGVKWGGKGLTKAGVSSGLGLGAIIMGAVDSLASGLDTMVVNKTRKMDTADLNARLKDIADGSSSIMQLGASLPEDKRGVFQQQLQQLIGQRRHSNTGNVLFDAAQELAIAKVAYDRASGRPSDKQMKAWENRLQSYQKPDAVGKINMGTTAEQWYRDETLAGNLFGALTGRKNLNDGTTAGKIGEVSSNIWRALSHPIEATRHFMTGEEVFHTSETPSKLGGGPELEDKSLAGKVLDLSPKLGLNATPGTEDGQKSQTGLQAAPKLSGPATYEDLIQTALTKAGLTSQIPAPGTYDPLTGIRGTNTAAQAGQALIGTHEATAKYRQQQQDIQRNQANLENAQRMQGVQLGTTAYGAQQNAQGLAAGASAKTAMTPSKLVQDYIRLSSDLGKREAPYLKNQTKMPPELVSQRQNLEKEYHQGRHALGMLNDGETPAQETDYAPNT